jgi:hypothetical protein
MAAAVSCQALKRVGIGLIQAPRMPQGQGGGRLDVAPRYCFLAPGPSAMVWRSVICEHATAPDPLTAGPDQPPGSRSVPRETGTQSTLPT